MPRKGFLFENSIWASRLVVGRRIRGWECNKWREAERGLNDKGIFFVAGKNVVRHSIPGNPRSKIIERLILALQRLMQPLPGFVGFNHREYNPEVLNKFLRRVYVHREHPGDMFLSFTQLRDAIDEVLLEYEQTVQNGRWLPGVSPIEVWRNGIGQFPGVAENRLKQLRPSTRHLLSTHWRTVNVTEKGIRFEVGGRPLVFWGDELIPWKHDEIPVRWNIEEPELLHCLPAGADPFTLKLRELDSWSATPEELAEAQAARNRWLRYGRALYSALPQPLAPIVCDAERGEKVEKEGAAISQATEEHRAQKKAEEEESKRVAALAGALGISVPKGEKVTQRALEARKRRLARTGQNGSSPERKENDEKAK
jgi:hypothetical protein